MTKEELERMTKEEIIIEYISLLNFEKKVEAENSKHYEQLHDLNSKINKLQENYDILMKYTRHIQEYLCKDIFELMKENEEDYD